MGNAINRIGQRINMLTAIERIPNYNGTGRTYYKCKCDCGNIHYVSNSSWNKAYSCGCTTRRSSSQRIDCIGQKFNHLTVLEMLYKYKGNQTYARCMCDCGQETIAYMGNIKSGKTKSCGCIEKLSRVGRLNHEKNLIGKQFGHLTVIKLTDKRYSNGGVGWLCECDCGNKIIVRSGNLIRGKTRSCGCNKKSKYEEYVESILDKLSITYNREYRFNDCRNHYPLPFDFYFEYRNKKFCIECQGQQHYEPIKHFGGEERFKTTKLNDKIKKKYCEKENIILICLPYTLSKLEMEQKILNILDPVTTTVA